MHQYFGFNNWLRTKVFYGWRIVAAGVVINAIISGLFMQAYGSYVSVWRDSFGWSNTLLSGGYSAIQGTTGGVAPIQGWLTDKFGPRKILRIGLVLMGLGLIALSAVNSIGFFYLTLILIALGVSFGGFLSLMVAIVNWFEKRRAFAISFLVTGFALGGLLVPLTSLSLETIGWRTSAFISGLIIIAVAFPITQIIKHRPEDIGLTVDGKNIDTKDELQQENLTGDKQENFTLKEALSSRTFWFLSLGHSTSLLVISAVQVHLVSHLQNELNMTLVQTGLIVAIITTSQIIGTFGGGFLGDRLNKRTLGFIAMVVQGGGLFLLILADSIGLIVIFAIVHGFIWGMRGPIMLALRADYFGRQNFGKIMGVSQFVMTSGMVVGPLFAGLLADRTGNYEQGFTILAIVALLGSIFFALLRKPNKVKRPTTAISS